METHASVFVLREAIQKSDFGKRSPSKQANNKRTRGKNYRKKDEYTQEEINK